MPTSVMDLIKDSYYLSQVKDPGEDIEGYETTVGLRTLNKIIAQWASLSIYIPTYTTLEIELEADVFTYEVTPPITQLLDANLLDQSNVLSVLEQVFLKRQNTFNYALGEQAPTRPCAIFIDNDKENMENNRSTVFFFPVPDAPYLATLRVKQMLQPLLAEDDIIEIPPQNEKALMYQTANDLSIIYASQLPPRFDKEYDKIMREMKGANRRDVTVKNRNPFYHRYRRFRPWNTFTG